VTGSAVVVVLGLGTVGIVVLVVTSVVLLTTGDGMSGNVVTLVGGFPQEQSQGMAATRPLMVRKNKRRDPMAKFMTVLSVFGLSNLRGC
jgi:hypothetical protein